MKPEEVIEMAKQAGMFTHKEVQLELQTFAKLVAAKEREACAKICIARGLTYKNGMREFNCAEKIRERGEP